MPQPSCRKLIIFVASILWMVTMYTASPSANHSWNGYHWARTTPEFTLSLGDNVSSVWDSHLDLASEDWSQSQVLNTIVDGGQAKGRNCRPPDGRVEVCNAAYGNNGWLGIAQISVSGKHITSGSVRLNDTYFNTSPYNTSAWRQLVVCQEVGHTFGLDHQDETFDNPNLGTCMDYTNNPSTNQHPNAHDYEELEIIYAHLDSTTTVGTAAHGAQGNPPDSPSEWGQLMKTTHGGKTQVFERDFGNGQKVVTFVIWA
jgi:hypothetical protein